MKLRININESEEESLNTNQDLNNVVFENPDDIFMILHPSSNENYYERLLNKVGTEFRLDNLDQSINIRDFLKDLVSDKFITFVKVNTVAGYEFFNDKFWRIQFNIEKYDKFYNKVMTYKKVVNDSGARPNYPNIITNLSRSKGRIEKNMYKEYCKIKIAMKLQYCLCLLLPQNFNRNEIDKSSMTIEEVYKWKEHCEEIYEDLGDLKKFSLYTFNNGTSFDPS